MYDLGCSFSVENADSELRLHFFEYREYETKRETMRNKPRDLGVQEFSLKGILSLDKKHMLK